MKLQSLIVIFIIIALPVIILLSSYVEYQVDTARLKTTYADKLLSATHDTVVTYQLNSTNDKYSSVADSRIRNIEAAVNTFATSFASNLGVNNSSASYAMSYVPALVFTLYDGYYLYVPTEVIAQGLDADSNPTTTNIFEHALKPYVYYTKQYKHNNVTIVINYSLDNYVAVYYYNGDDETYQSRAGYLELIDNSNGIDHNGLGELTYKGEVIPQNETTIKNSYDYTVSGEQVNSFWTTTERNDYNQSAYQYYADAYDFTVWYNDKISKLVSTDKDNLIIDENNLPYQGAESNFNNEKYDVIKDSLEKNLRQSMELFRGVSGTDFRMPELTGTDWDKILNNVCVISFMQGIPCGTTIYNDYVIMPSSENEEFINENHIYYIGYDIDPLTGEYTSNGTYHRIGCSELDGDAIVRI